MERILIKFTKTKGAKFLSHLDTMRTIHRALRRAEIPIAYSKGFNPHPNISVAAPLSLGLGSVAEYADIELKEHMNIKELKEKLNNALPDGMEIVDALEIKGKMPPSMAAVEFARYEVILNHNAGEDILKDIIDKILGEELIERVKKTKSGEKLVNIRPFIENISINSYSGDSVKIDCLLKAGSKGSISIELVSDLIKDYSEGKIFGHPIIERKEIYGISDNKMLSFISYFSRK